MATPLQPHQQRVVDEMYELNDKRMKLSAFLTGAIFRTLPEAEKERLQRQSDIMHEYSEVLRERIQAF
jgi:hypothetical protein